MSKYKQSQSTTDTVPFANLARIIVISIVK